VCIKEEEKEEEEEFKKRRLGCGRFEFSDVTL